MESDRESAARCLLLVFFTNKWTFGTFLVVDQ